MCVNSAHILWWGDKNHVGLSCLLAAMLEGRGVTGPEGSRHSSSSMTVILTDSVGKRHREQTSNAAAGRGV